VNTILYQHYLIWWSTYIFFRFNTSLTIVLIIKVTPNFNCILLTPTIRVNPIWTCTRNCVPKSCDLVTVGHDSINYNKLVVERLVNLPQITKKFSAFPQIKLCNLSSLFYVTILGLYWVISCFPSAPACIFSATHFSPLLKIWPLFELINKILMIYNLVFKIAAQYQPRIVVKRL